MKGRSAMRTEHTHTITRHRGGEPGRTHPAHMSDVTHTQVEPSDHPDAPVP